MLVNSPFITNATDTAAIRISRLVVFCKKDVLTKDVLTNFAKFTRKILREGLVFKEAADLQSYVFGTLAINLCKVVLLRHIPL